MVFQYKITIIGNRRYILSSELISETGAPRESFQFTQPFTLELRNEEGKPQWTIRENPDYNPETDHIDHRYIIEYDPLEPTIEEIEAKCREKIKHQLQNGLPDLILANRDNPENLAKALCDRAKELEKETP